jgi:Holliday junction DNA helicase RuvB
MSTSHPGPDALRPGTLDDFCGQPDIVRELRIVLGAAKARDQLPDHILFAGPPGLGKTTLSGIVAAELAAELQVTSGPALDRPASLISVLVALPARSVLFVDEIHRMPRHVEEVLYSAMEDGVIDLVVGDGPKARAVSFTLRPFVLVGATTQEGLLSAPLRDRFGFTAKLTPYDVDTLTRIVTRSARLLGVDVDGDAARVIASRARGTPRVANTLLRRVRDWAQVQAATSDGVDIGDVHVDGRTATTALDEFGVDHVGLDRRTRELLDTLVTAFDGGPVGLSTLAAAVGEAPLTLEEVYEPFLLRLGFLARTPRGRTATLAAYEHLGRTPPARLVASETAEAQQLTLEGQ